MQVLFIILNSGLDLQKVTMIAKTAVVICLLAAAASEDLESIVSDIFGSITSAIPVPSEPATPITYKACTMMDGQLNGECIPYYLCNVKDQFSDLTDIHLPVDNPCENILDVCCSASDRVQPPQSETKDSDPPQ